MADNLVFFVVHGPIRDEPEVNRLELDADTQAHFSSVFANAAARIENTDLQVVELHPLHKPDETEVHELPEFALPLVMESAFENPTTTRAFPPAQLGRAKLRAIVGIRQDDNGTPVAALFQRKTQAEIVAKNGGILASSTVFKRIPKPVLKVEPKVHAVWTPATLRFKSPRSLATFLNLEDHTREATDEDVTAVLQEDHVTVENQEAFIGRLKPWHRKRLAMLHDSGLLQQIDPDSAAELASEFVELEVVGADGSRSIKLPDDPSSLRKTLKFLCEEYYYGVLTEQKYEANSTRPYREAS
jgi:hypothetical protein